MAALISRIFRYFCIYCIQLSPWIDIAVLTNDAGDKECSTLDTCTTTRCQYYLENSFNKNSKGYCDVDHSAAEATVTEKTLSAAWIGRYWYNNKENCESAGFVWYEISLSDWLNLDYPVCRKTGFSRVNQLGNSHDDTVAGTDNVPKVRLFKITKKIKFPQCHFIHFFHAK